MSISESKSIVSLFSEAIRTRHHPKEPLESTYHFLDTVAGPYWEKSRQVTNDWFGHISASEKRDLKGRFQSKKDHQHRAAYWEIYLHEYLRRCGYSLEVHPLHGPGVKSPDFLASNASESFFLEATTIDLPRHERDENGRRQPIFDAIQRKVHSDNFGLGLESLVDGHESPPTEGLCLELNRWLNSLHPDDCFPAEGMRPVYPECQIVFGSWKWQFTALPNLSQRCNQSVIRSWPSQGGLVSDYLHMAVNLKEKADRYGDLDRPLLLAMMNPRVRSGDLGELHRALFGHLGERPKNLCEGIWDTNFIRSPTPFWFDKEGPKHTNVIGVLYLNGASPWSVTENSVTAWECPWGAAGLPIGLIANRFSLNCITGRFDFTSASRKPHEVFGLPEGWPNCEPWPCNADDTSESTA